MYTQRKLTDSTHPGRCSVCSLLPQPPSKAFVDKNTLAGTQTFQRLCWHQALPPHYLLYRGRNNPEAVAGTPQTETLLLSLGTLC